jgi:hypothetical protein
LREIAAHAIRDGRTFDFAGIEIADQGGAKLAYVSAADAIPTS